MNICPVCKDEVKLFKNRTIRPHMHPHVRTICPGTGKLEDGTTPTPKLSGLSDRNWGVKKK